MKKIIEFFKVKNRIAYLVIAIIFILLVLFISFGFDYKLHQKDYVINTNSVDNIKIGFIADLHSDEFGEKQQDLVDMVIKSDIDILLYGGDIFDDRKPYELVFPLLEKLKGKYPSFYVSGNHEICTNDLDNIKDIVRSYDITVLEGDCVPISINNQIINICGIDDPNLFGNDYDELSRIQLNNLNNIINENSYNVLLSHRPELIDEYENSKFDLILSGHAHGGQIRIPLIFPNGLYAPNQGFFPKYTGGKYKLNNDKILIVSKGLAKTNVKTPRFYNDLEYSVIHLEK